LSPFNAQQAAAFGSSQLAAMTNEQRAALGL
jgi:hypothetical protein